MISAPETTTSPCERSAQCLADSTTPRSASAFVGFEGERKTNGTIELMRQILRGIDRGVLEATGATVGSADPRFVKPEAHKERANAENIEDKARA